MSFLKVGEKSSFFFFYVEKRSIIFFLPEWMRTKFNLKFFFFSTYFREQSTQNILGFGLNNYNQLGLTTKTDLPIFVPKLSKFTNVKTIAGGIHHTLVLTNDGECYAIGRKEYGRLGLGDVAEDIEELQQVPSLKNKKIVEIACGEISSFAITQDGKIYSWGMGTSLQLGTGNEDDELIPALLTGKQVKDKNVIKVASGGQHTVFIVEDVSIYLKKKHFF